LRGGPDSFIPSSEPIHGELSLERKGKKEKGKKRERRNPVIMQRIGSEAGRGERRKEKKESE